MNEMNDEIIAKNLIDEINFQDGSIVSKQLLKKSNGNITFFAFGKDETLTEHTSPYEAFVYLAEGEMEIKIDGKPVMNKIGAVNYPAPKYSSCFESNYKFENAFNYD